MAIGILIGVLGTLAIEGIAIFVVAVSKFKGEKDGKEN